MPRSSQSNSARPSDRQDGRGASPVNSSFITLAPIAEEPTQSWSPETPKSVDETPTIITPITPNPAHDPLLGLNAGSRLGNYEIVDAIGSGGMATVLKARDLDLGRIVALKILPPRMNLDRENVARFKLEARSAAQLDHDNIARVFTTGEDQGLHFIAFEFVEGETLRSLMTRRGILPASECIRLMIQIAAGLTHASARGVVHRDIKPSNIIITPDGKAKIVDMGLARSLTVNGGVTQSGVTLGTFDYISPEQAIDPRRTDVRSDIYSLGCTFYHALTGRPPVPDGTAAKKLHAHQHEPIPDPRLYNPNLPDELAAILAKMMAKNPGKRYADPLLLIQALNGVAQRLNLPLNLEGLSGLDGQLPSDSPWSRVLPPPPRLPVGLLIGVAAFIVCIVVLATLTRPNPVAYEPIRFPEPQVLETPSPSVALAPPPRQVPPPSMIVDPEVASGDALARALENSQVTTIRLVAGTTYDLSQLSQAVAVAQRLNSLVIEGPAVERAEQLPIIRIGTKVQLNGQTPIGGLTFADLKSLTLRRLRIEIVGSSGFLPYSMPNSMPSVGLMLDEVNDFQLEDVTIVPTSGLRDVKPIGVSLRSEREPSRVTISNCYVGLNGGTGLQLSGVMSVAIQESGFGPHDAAIELQRSALSVPAASKLSIDQCTFAIDQGTAFQSDAGLNWTIESGYSLYATPPGLELNSALRASSPNVLQVASNGTGSMTKTMTLYRGRDGAPNAYFNVRPFAEWNVEEQRYRSYHFAELFELEPSWNDSSPALDSLARELSESPWAESDPFQVARSSEPWNALRLNKHLPELRVERDNYSSIIGMIEQPLPIPPNQIQRPKLYDPWPLPALNGLTDPHVKIWCPDPSAEMRDPLPRNVYENLSTAVAALNPGDTLQLKFDGVRTISEPIIFPAVAKLNVKVEPFPGSKPILAPAAGKRREAFLFQIVEGSVTFENLNFLMEAKPSDTFETMALLNVVAARQCGLKNCVVTMIDPSANKLAVVLLDNARQAMTADSGDPAIRFEKSLIRGEGRAMVARSVQPFDLAIRNSLLALNGSMIVVEPSTASDHTSRITLERSTFTLGGALLDLHPKEGNIFARLRFPEWVPAVVAMNQSIVSPWQNAGRMLSIEGMDPMRIGDTLAWSGKGNWYANFSPSADYMDVLPAETMARRKTYSAEEWFTFTRESADAVIRTVRFNDWPGMPSDVARIQPEDVEVKSISYGMGMREPGTNVPGVSPHELPKPLR